MNAAAAVLILAAVFVMLACVLRERRLLGRISAMLEQAAEGTYTEKNYDETMLSALETKMVRFLGSSAISARAVAEERDRIKTLISDISHQTKTPIANILLYTELLEERDMQAEEMFAVQALKAQTEKLKFLVEAMVKMSRLENGILAVCPKRSGIDGLLEQVFRQILPAAEQKGLTVTLEKSGLIACFDEKWTEEALYNLADNAVKYTGQGGSVTLSARAFQLFTRIDVRDTGMGIPESEQAQIFTRFYRSKDASQTEGIGVGLFLAREIISREGGYIRVESGAGKGSLFSIYLPCQAEQEREVKN